MSTATPHLGLVKPDPGEKVLVVPHVNNNYDKIDAKVLNHSGRISGVEAALGVDSGEEWPTWVPELMIQEGARTFVTTVTTADYFVFGEIVFLNVDLVITDIADTYLSGTGTKFILKLPLKTKKKMITGTVFVFQNVTGDDLVLTPMWRDNDTMSFAMTETDDVDGNLQLPDDDPELSLQANANFRASVIYRTTGVAVV